MLEIRRNIYGEVPYHHFFIPMPIREWRRQTSDNTVDLTAPLVDLDIWAAWTNLPPTPSVSPRWEDLTLEEVTPNVQVESSSLRPRALPSLSRNVLSDQTSSWRNSRVSTRMRLLSASPQRGTRMETRTCTHVCCCPRSSGLKQHDSGTSTATIQMCREYGASQSGSLI